MSGVAVTKRPRDPVQRMDNGVKRLSISAAICCYKNSIAGKVH